MTPLGHAAVGFSSQLLDRRLSWRGLVVGAVILDIDFALFWSPHFNAIHRVITHNLLFVAILGLLAWVVGDRCRGGVVSFSVVLGALTHLLVDSMLDGNPSNGIGVALFYPWSMRSFSPINLVQIEPDPPTWNELDRMIPAVLRGMAFEVPFCVISAVLIWRRWGPSAARSQKK